MVALIFISLVTVVGLAAVYQIVAQEIRSSEKLPSSDFTQGFIQKFVTRKSSQPEKIFKPSVKKDKSSLGLFSFWGETRDPKGLKVEPITSLKDYYAQKSNESPSEINLVGKKAEPVFKADAVKSLNPQTPRSEIHLPEDVYLELKARFEKLQEDYRQIDRLLAQETKKLQDVRKELETERLLQQDFAKVKIHLERQIIEVRKELIDKEELINSLRQQVNTQNPPNRIAAAFSESSETPKEFMSLPPDLMSVSKTPVRNSSAFEQKVENKDLDMDETSFYRMPSQDEIIRHLRQKKYAV